MNLQLCWLRTDLREFDNLALCKALQSGPTVAVYIATLKQWALHHDAPIKIDFWRRNLLELKQALARIDVPLLVFEVDLYNEIPLVFDYLIDELNPECLHFNKEYPLNEATRDLGVMESFRAKGIHTKAYDDRVLLKPESVLNKSGSAFKVFTPFAKTSKSLIQQKAPYSLQKPHYAFSSPSLPKLSHSALRQDMSQISWPEPDPQWALNWPAGEEHARKVLSEYCQAKITYYKQNRDFPAIHGTSRLSPYLSSGILSIRECWLSAQSFQHNTGVDTWLNELLWREFYTHILVHFPHVCKNQSWRKKYDAFVWNSNSAAFTAWSQGNTGFPLLDAAMRQLLETGWMHNRLRMVCAMFLAKNLLLDWRLGEAWFMSHLIDGDFAANNGGWQWASSTGTDAAPYFRVFNPVRQSERFDPNGDFIKTYLPELEHLDKKQIHLPKAAPNLSYPAPMVDLKESRLLAIEAFKNI